MLILSIPKIPEKLRNINSTDIKERMDTENLKNNISRIRDDVGLDEKLSQIKDDDRISRITGSQKGYKTQMR